MVATEGDEVIVTAGVVALETARHGPRVQREPRVENDSSVGAPFIACDEWGGSCRRYGFPGLSLTPLITMGP